MVLYTIKEMPHCEKFQKIVSYINDNNFLQLVEYIGDETL